MTIEIPEAWRQLNYAAWHGTVLIVGGVDTGKSTLTKYLVGQLRTSSRSFAWIDGDPGQPALGPPSTMTCQFQIDSLNRCLKQWFVESVSPVGHMLPVIVGAVRLTDAAQRAGAEVILYDTTGFIAPDRGGLHLKQAKIEALQPSAVIALQREGELEPLLKPLRKRTRIRLIELNPVKEVRSRTTEERRIYRASRFAPAFKNASPLTLSWPSLAIWPQPRFDQDRLLAFCDENGFIQKLGVVAHVDSANREVTVMTSLKSLKDINAIRVGSVYLNLKNFSDRQAPKP